MAHVIYWFGVMNVAAMVAFPLLEKTRLQAILKWFSAFSGNIACGIAIMTFFPSFKPPAWDASIWWVAAQWLALITGLIIAVKKPRKRDAARSQP